MLTDWEIHVIIKLLLNDNIKNKEEKLTMRYMQLRLSDEEFITIKKAALDANTTLENFLKAAVFEKLFSDSAAIIKGELSPKQRETENE